MTTFKTFLKYVSKKVFLILWRTFQKYLWICNLNLRENILRLFVLSLRTLTEIKKNSQQKLFQLDKMKKKNHAGSSEKSYSMETNLKTQQIKKNYWRNASIIHNCRLKNEWYIFCRKLKPVSGQYWTKNTSVHILKIHFNQYTKVFFAKKVFWFVRLRRKKKQFFDLIIYLMRHGIFK